MSGLERELETASEQEEKPMPENIYQNLHKIGFVCNGGMGSSAMGATVLKKKLAAAGLEEIEVIHTPVSSIPADVQIVVTHEELGERAAHSNPNAERILITNFLAAPEYATLVEDLKKRNL